MQQTFDQDLNTPSIPSIGVGASAAEENRGQRFQEHICTCGTGCGCLACPTHPYNDITKQEALQAGRLLSQEPFWNSTDDFEVYGSTQSEVPPGVPSRTIIYGDEWLDAPYQFELSDLTSQSPMHGSQGFDCC